VKTESFHKKKENQEGPICPNEERGPGSKQSGKGISSIFNPSPVQLGQRSVQRNMDSQAFKKQHKRGQLSQQKRNLGRKQGPFFAGAKLMQQPVRRKYQARVPESRLFW